MNTADIMINELLPVDTGSALVGDAVRDGTSVTEGAGIDGIGVMDGTTVVVGEGVCVFSGKSTTGALTGWEPDDGGFDVVGAGVTVGALVGVGVTGTGVGVGAMVGTGVGVGCLYPGILGTGGMLGNPCAGIARTTISSILTTMSMRAVDMVECFSFIVCPVLVWGNG